VTLCILTLQKFDALEFKVKFLVRYVFVSFFDRQNTKPNRPLSTTDTGLLTATLHLTFPATTPRHHLPRFLFFLLTAHDLRTELLRDSLAATRSPILSAFPSNSSSNSHTASFPLVFLRLRDLHSRRIFIAFFIHHQFHPRDFLGSVQFSLQSLIHTGVNAGPFQCSFGTIPLFFTFSQKQTQPESHQVDLLCFRKNIMKNSIATFLSLSIGLGVPLWDFKPVLRIKNQRITIFRCVND
jgi:hypothetical protein